MGRDEEPDRGENSEADSAESEADYAGSEAGSERGSDDSEADSSFEANVEPVQASGPQDEEEDGLDQGPCARRAQARSSPALARA